MRLALSKLFCLFIFIDLALSVSAAQHAVLIGIGDYPKIRSLEGPVNDVALVRSLLLSRWQFDEARIVTLVNKEATRSKILEAIRTTGVKAQKGDSVVIYFSGHGTSAADPNSPVTLPTKTGALVPYDIEGIRNAEQLTRTLIIGTRDLRPLLIELDQKGITVLVITDACYSGNIIRDKLSTDDLPKRYVRFADLLPVSERVTKLTRRMRRQSGEAFPYDRVFSLSAAREYEAAEDIPAAKLERYPTIDGKPHGAFTDSLARILSNTSLKNSGSPLTLNELHKRTKQLMQDRRFNSIPTLLPKASKDRPNPGGHAVFALSD